MRCNEAPSETADPYYHYYTGAPVGVLQNVVKSRTRECPFGSFLPSPPLSSPRLQRTPGKKNLPPSDRPPDRPLGCKKARKGHRAAVAAGKWITTEMALKDDDDDDERRVHV
ncbi:hypothetical protein ZHAS_00020713 [Anopheles sinensis]|uniref:Uncharacterized protein n=1 Tax=Anopheles sinensis TaxID=74873 RepID=A0A084WQH7_ANOSI|nr:hypothetical protein ZHAS_00020713 [Anopheles sinensis]